MARPTPWGTWPSTATATCWWASVTAHCSAGALRTRLEVMRAQDPEVLTGKVLRVDPSTGRGVPGNPLYAGDGSANSSRVLALGFRNPFRFAVDGEHLVVGDVGESAFEEIDSVHLDQPAGQPANFGWPCLEADVHDRPR